MKTGRSQRETLLDLTIDLATQAGLEGVSLRQVAKGADVSTTAIFHNFEGKADLIREAVDLAIKRDRDFHAKLQKEAFQFISGQLAFADFVATYIDLLVQRKEARFLAEVLVKLKDHPDCRDALIKWRTMRCEFWEPLITTQKLPPEFTSIVGKYVVMEELYAHALHQQVGYQLLLRDTCRALCDAVFNHGGTNGFTSNVSSAMAVRPFSVRQPEHVSFGSAVPEQLLDTAVALINRSGMRSLNQRALAAEAGVAPSIIPYHFKNMNALTTQAIWRALVQGIPAQFDPDDESSQFPNSFTTWLGMIEDMMQVKAHQDNAGFYISVSRLSAEACLLAGRDRQFLPLIAYLRGLEGWGTYRASQAIAEVKNTIRRDHAAAFGVWIKSEAVLRNAGLADTPESRTAIARGASLIFPTRSEA